MGISLITGLFLARHAGVVAKAKRGIILGRQKMHMPERRMQRFVRSLGSMGFDVTESDITQPDGFTEALFARLGYPAIEAMDFTDKEGAPHIHDLNKPCPDHLKGQFDIVIDGGTTEHIFYIATALDTCHELLAPGGVMLQYVAADGWFGHGFFQTGPDVPWRYWHHARGYEMLEVSIVPRKTPGQVIVIPDPTGQPRGGERALAGPHMLLMAARKPMVDPPYNPPIQGHYVEG
ncbi:MAG: hypothetical protein ACRC14_11370 [Paracoccaceae bacterium]